MAGSFNAQTNNYNVLNANNVSIYIGTVVVAFGSSVTVQTPFGARGLFAIGSMLPQEIQQLQSQPALTLDSMVFTDAGLLALGYPSNLLAVLSNNKFKISVLNNAGILLFNYIDCVADSNTFQIAQNSPVVENVTFLARDVVDQFGLSLIQPGSAQNNARSNRPVV